MVAVRFRGGLLADGKPGPCNASPARPRACAAIVRAAGRCLRIRAPFARCFADRPWSSAHRRGGGGPIPSPVPDAAAIQPEVLDALQRVWGYDTLRPLQAEAIEAALAGREALIVLPTGAGKSLCYQLPALVTGKLTVVVSPLIALMKDQVDGLRLAGYPAAALHSQLEAAEAREAMEQLDSGELRLLLVAPERLLTAHTLTRIARQAHRLGAIAIDEAHCISHWGHDFRPEYRQIRRLRENFPEASFHAYTATATERVREDIARQLEMNDPLILVGSFDRPNLTYRVVPRGRELAQVEEIAGRHADEAGIVYCIRRRDVDTLAGALKARGRNVVAYHAGLSADERRNAQEAFSREECDLVVATVAFGMGIDRSNVRYVIHTGMPKSIEHYQQETGRAGRDGLEAECVLLYSPADAITWRTILEKSDQEDRSEDFIRSALGQIREMQSYASGVICRHRALVQYFGQEYADLPCNACDVCLGEFTTTADSLPLAQKILSCVARMGDSFGAAYLVSVLRGENLAKIRERRHDELTTFGILRAHPKEELRDYVDQLVSMRALVSSGDMYATLRLGPAARAILKGEASVSLRERVSKSHRATSREESQDWAGVDRELFDRLRAWRKQEADAREVPPFVIFGDRTLRAIAAARPSSLEGLNRIYGIGQAKLREFGRQLVALVAAHVSSSGGSLDSDGVQVITPSRPRPAKSSATRDAAHAAFAKGASMDDVVELTGRARSTVAAYLTEFIADTAPASLDPWIDERLYRRVAESADRLGFETLRPIFEDLNQEVSYEEIRIVVTHLAAAAVR